MARELLVGVLLGAGRTGVRHHAARGAHLDQLGAVLDLVADRLAHLVDAVGDALLDGERQDAGAERLEHRGVEVAAGRRDGVPGRDDARAVDPAEVDRLLEGDVEQQAAGLHEQAEVADGREAGPQGAAGVGDARAASSPPGRPARRPAGCAWSGPPMRRLTSMSIRPGQEGEVAEVDHLGVVGHRRRAPPPTMRSPSIEQRRRARRSSPATTSSSRALRRWIGRLRVGEAWTRRLLLRSLCCSDNDRSQGAP